MQSFLKKQQTFLVNLFQKKPKSLFYFDWKIQKMTPLCWVLVFSIPIQYFAYPMNRSKMTKSRLFLKNFQTVLCFLLKTLYCCQLLGQCCKVNKACFKGFLSRKANLLSFLMKKENSQSTTSAKKFMKRTVCLQPSKCLSSLIININVYQIGVR